MNQKEMLRNLSIETTQPVIRNVAAANHDGLVTIQMKQGVITKVWAGTKEGLLLWKGGKAIAHIVPNVDGCRQHE